MTRKWALIITILILFTGPVTAENEYREYVIHEVQTGETLSQIAMRYYDTYIEQNALEKIKRFNHIDDPNNIELGKKIKIPKIEGLPFLTSRLPENIPEAAPAAQAPVVAPPAPPEKDIPQHFDNIPDPPVDPEPPRIEAPPVPPAIRISSKLVDNHRSRKVIFHFQAETPPPGNPSGRNTLRYSYRLVPINPQWSRPAVHQTAVFSDLKTGSYFFQVKAVTPEGYTFEKPAEIFFNIEKKPSYTDDVLFWGKYVLVGLFAAALSWRIARRRIVRHGFNPYATHVSITGPELFYGRENIKNDILATLKRKNVILAGEHRIGKTSILEQLHLNIKKPYFAFYCSLDSVKESFFFTYVMNHLVNRIRTIWRSAPLNLVLHDKSHTHYHGDDFQKDLDALVRMMKTIYHPGASILMCLDDIDDIWPYPVSIHERLHHVLSSPLVRIVAVKNLTVLEDEPSPIWFSDDSIQVLNVPPLSPAAAISLITLPVKGFYAYSPDAIDLILHKSDCRPYRIQSICKHAVRRVQDQKKRKIKTDDIEAVYQRLIRLEFNREFEPFWEALSDDAKRTIVRYISRKDIPPSHAFTQEIIRHPFNRRHRVVSVSKDNKIQMDRIFEDWLVLTGS